MIINTFKNSLCALCENLHALCGLNCRIVELVKVITTLKIKIPLKILFCTTPLGLMRGLCHVPQAAPAAIDV